MKVELRRSSVLMTGAVIFAIAVGMLYLVGNAPWQKSTGAWNLQWDSFAYYLRFLHNLLFPVALGGGALFGLRDSRCGVAELFASVPRPPWQRLARSAAAFGLAMVASSVAIVVAGGKPASPTRSPP
ncbi:hypothetical protein MOQ72_14680 [Saccharopolyspora sp. K220]|uniref:hypothetical protein n=1 Tax=Saccharopolyspora soli TaxID=2926618 RepID=UPI001F579552|nr:hypothetical protein [Saccharopolyspora soli]MCI2418683.1 hypothetical protein [Saccharopolyspora soli]